MRKLFEFSGDETFWVVAEDIEKAEQYLKDDCNEEQLFEDNYTVRIIRRDIHFKIEDEDTGNVFDVWEMIDKDELEDIKIPYMIASTLY